MTVQLCVNIPHNKPVLNACMNFSSPSAKSTWSYGGSTPAYSYGGNTYNSSGYLANPSRDSQIRARDAGANASCFTGRVSASKSR